MFVLEVIDNNFRCQVILKFWKKNLVFNLVKGENVCFSLILWCQTWSPSWNIKLNFFLFLRLDWFFSSFDWFGFFLSTLKLIFWTLLFVFESVTKKKQTPKFHEGFKNYEKPNFSEFHLINFLLQTEDTFD
jgi:hypothetical protein